MSAHPGLPHDLDGCRALDAADPLAPLRAQFELPDDGLIYLDGNSLGPLPRSVPARLAKVATEEWGRGLIRSWNDAGWIERPRRLGDKIGRLIGAAPGQTLVADSTSINVYKVLHAALQIQRASPLRQGVLLSESGNFPTDLYIAQSLCRQFGTALELADGPDALDARLARGGVAVLLLTQVDYRSGYLHDMARLSAACHGQGGLVVWDLAHSAGALPVDLLGADADFAVGCGYKYLNGGPGAPAFVWVHPRHVDAVDQPLSGWLGHAAPFAFGSAYQPAPGIARYQCGTPPILALAALDCGVDTLLLAEAYGGMAQLRAKSVALGELFLREVERRGERYGLVLASPRDAERRGSQVCFAHAEGGYAMVQALIARGVIGDFRAPDVLRFGFAPLYLRFEDVWHAAERIEAMLEREEWRAPRFQQRAAVT
jgi:kynureninase